MKDVSRLQELALYVLLVVAVLAVFGQAVTFRFLDWDDMLYVRDEPVISQGITTGGIMKAFTSRSQGTHYMPLTTLSHMLDIQLFGFKAGWHHAMSLLLHTANILLLFVILRQMTGLVWPSTVVAALFGLHPLHVETVVWISDRKDLLCTFFGLLAIYSHVQYAKRQEVEWYVLLIGSFVLSLLSKSMLVTLPFLLLLLDYWPLERVIPVRNGQKNSPALDMGKRDMPRFLQRTWRQLVVEKIPLLIITAAFVTVMFTADANPAPRSAPEIAIDHRLSNALVSCVRYLTKTFCPTKLCAWYLHPNLPGGTPWQAWQVIGAALLLLALSGLVLFRLRRPYATVGWLWFLGTLVPVLGWTDSMIFAMADRYTYVSLIGLFIAVTWALHEASVIWGKQRPSFSTGGVTAAAIVACMFLSWQQAKHWRESALFFERELAVEPNNPWFHNNLGVVLESAGDHVGALHHLETALKIWPGQLNPHLTLKEIYSSQGDYEKARESMMVETRTRERIGVP